MDEPIYELINRDIPETAKGENILFFSELVVPCENWLAIINRGFEKYGSRQIFGAIIENKYHNIIHAGVVFNSNNSPVSAYKHLDADFPHANKERAFQALDYFIAIKKELFIELGGFWHKAGEYAFMDLCLRTSNDTQDPEIATLLPQLHLLKLKESTGLNLENSINFFSRWHGRLWDNEDILYKADGVSNLQLESARLTRAMELTGR